VDRPKLRWSTRDGDDGPAQRAGEASEVHDVEAPDGDPVQEDRSDPLERGQRPDEGGDPLGRIAPVDADVPESNSLDQVRVRPCEGGDRRVPVRPTERPIVDRGDPQVRLPERAP
jgi:hypothetical protein